MERKRVILYLVIAVLALGSLSFLKYKQIATQQRREINGLQAEVTTKTQTIVDLQQAQDAERAETSEEAADETGEKESEVITNFLRALYEHTSNNLTERYEAIQPYLMGEALGVFQPSDENIISNDDGYSTTTVNNIAIYQQQPSEAPKEMVVFFTLTQDILDPAIESHLFMTLQLDQQDGVWKISVIHENQSYKKT